jgi:hypothetical protein
MGGGCSSRKLDGASLSSSMLVPLSSRFESSDATGAAGSPVSCAVIESEFCESLGASSIASTLASAPSMAGNAVLSQPHQPNNATANITESTVRFMSCLLQEMLN